MERRDLWPRSLAALGGAGAISGAGLVLAGMWTLVPARADAHAGNPLAYFLPFVLCAVGGTITLGAVGALAWAGDELGGQTGSRLKVLAKWLFVGLAVCAVVALVATRTAECPVENCD